MRPDTFRNKETAIRAVTAAGVEFGSGLDVFGIRKHEAFRQLSQAAGHLEGNIAKAISDAVNAATLEPDTSVCVVTLHSGARETVYAGEVAEAYSEMSTGSVHHKTYPSKETAIQAVTRASMGMSSLLGSALGSVPDPLGLRGHEAFKQLSQATGQLEGHLAKAISRGVNSTTDNGTTLDPGTPVCVVTLDSGARETVYAAEVAEAYSDLSTATPTSPPTSSSYAVQAAENIFARADSQSRCSENEHDTLMTQEPSIECPEQSMSRDCDEALKALESAVRDLDTGSEGATPVKPAASAAEVANLARQVGALTEQVQQVQRLGRRWQDSVMKSMTSEIKMAELMNAIEAQQSAIASLCSKIEGDGSN